MNRFMLVVSADTLGRGDDELGRRLMIKYLGQVAALADKPSTVAFYNSGVKLLTQLSPVLEALGELDRAGTELIACGTCVEHFAIRPVDAVRVTDMREIVATVQAFEKVCTV